jgi:hypothetical protein
MRTGNLRRLAHLWSLSIAGRSLPAAARSEYAARMQAAVLRGPFGAQVRFGRSAVPPNLPVERAGHPIVLQIAAGGDHLHVKGEVSAPLDLTEIRRPAGPHQSLQPAVAPGTHDLDL